jgi:hypothetical protein
MFLSFTTRLIQLAGALFCGVLLAGSVTSAEVPSFVKQSLHSSHAAPVAAVLPSLAADVVILEGGLAQGLRLGMICSVTRGPRAVGELIIIESRSDRAAGLILNLVNDSIIQAGDIARVNTLQSS